MLMCDCVSNLSCRSDTEKHTNILIYNWEIKHDKWLLYFPGEWHMYMWALSIVCHPFLPYISLFIIIIYYLILFVCLFQRHCRYFTSIKQNVSDFTSPFPAARPTASSKSRRVHIQPQSKTNTAIISIRAVPGWRGAGARYGVGPPSVRLRSRYGGGGGGGGFRSSRGAAQRTALISIVCEQKKRHESVVSSIGSGDVPAAERIKSRGSESESKDEQLWTTARLLVRLFPGTMCFMHICCILVIIKHYKYIAIL